MSTIPDITVSNGKTALGDNAIITCPASRLFALSASSLSLGILCALCAPGFGLWWICWIGFIPAVLWLFTLPSPKRTLCSGLLFGTAFHAIYLSWLLSLHPMDWLGFSPAASLSLATSAWLIASLSGGFAFGILALVATSYLKTAKALPWLRYCHWLVLPSLWLAIFHFYQANALWFPWALLNYTQTSVPLMNFLVHLTGTSAIAAFLPVSANVILAQALNSLPNNKWGSLLLGILALLACIWFFPVPAIPVRTPFAHPITAYQGGVDIGTIKTGKDFEKLSQNAYLSPLLNMALPKGSILILPEEGVVPGWVNQERPLENSTVRQLQQLADDRQIAILSGISSFKTERHKTAVFNSTVLLQPNFPAQFYDKNRLVPFGESVPYLESDFVNSTLETLNIPYQFNFRAGNKAAPLLVMAQQNLPYAGASIGSLICFELIYPELSKRYQRQGAQLLVNNSNLGWFHQNTLLSQQFLAIGQVRTLETGLPLVIASNNGPSAIITPDGHIQKQVSKPAKASLSWRIKPLSNDARAKDTLK